MGEMWRRESKGGCAQEGNWVWSAPTRAASSCAHGNVPCRRHHLAIQTECFSLLVGREQDPLSLCPPQAVPSHTSRLSSFLQLALLTELSQNRSGDSCRPFAGSQSGLAFNSIFQNENFQLQLAPPPVAED